MTFRRYKTINLSLKRHVPNFSNARASQEILKKSCSILQMSIEFPMFITSHTYILKPPFIIWFTQMQLNIF